MIQQSVKPLQLALQTNGKMACGKRFAACHRQLYF
jgi:hypothetical protein